MKVYKLYAIHDLRFEDTELPYVKPDEVLVEVKAAGICGSDVPRIYDAGTYSYPLIPGHEFSGKVVKTGGKAAETWQNKRVGIFPLIPCRGCIPCQKGHYELCRNYSYLGSRTDGGFAEYVAVPEWNLIELPDNVTYEAGAMLEPMAVSVHAMRSCYPAEKDSVAVCGLGTIGILLAMFLKEAGIGNPIVIGNKDFQKKMVMELGIPEDCYLDSRKEDVEAKIKERTEGIGVDVFFECVGKNETSAMAINCTAPNGRIQIVGNPASDMVFDRNIYWKILRNQLTVKGSWNSLFTHESDDDWHYVLTRLTKGIIHPEQCVTQKLSFEELKKGLLIMRDKSEEYVKVMAIF